MAAIAGSNCVTAGQGKCGWMPVGRSLPSRCGDGMTLGTLKRKPGHGMVRVLGFLIGWQVAALAVQREIDKLPIGVAGLAIHARVHSHQREARLLMALDHLFRGLPAGRGVAGLTAVPELAAMNVKVAAYALGARLGKLQRCMTRDALHLNVLPDEGKHRLGVIEVQHRSQRRPPLGGMALLTG